MIKKDIVSAIIKTAIATITFENVQRYLPFQTRIVSGENFNHIQSRTVYDIRTYGKPRFSYIEQTTLYPEFTVEENDTLCRRTGKLISTKGGVNDENCPGCLAIAQGIIKRDIEQVERA
jgi:hypothetical protein